MGKKERNRWNTRRRWWRTSRWDRGCLRMDRDRRARPPHKEGPFHLEREREEMCFSWVCKWRGEKEEEEIRYLDLFGRAGRSDRLSLAVRPPATVLRALFIPAATPIHSKCARVKSSNHFIFLPRIPYNSTISLSTWILMVQKMILDLLRMNMSNNNKIW